MKHLLQSIIQGLHGVQNEIAAAGRHDSTQASRYVATILGTGEHDRFRSENEQQSEQEMQHYNLSQQILHLQAQLQLFGEQLQQHLANHSYC